MKKILFWICLLLTFSCSSREKPYMIGLDRDWFRIVLNGQDANLNGFINDLMKEIAKINRIEIVLVDTNWDNLFLSLFSKKCDAIFSNIQPYNFNLAKYSFSRDILQTGYALIIPKDKNYKILKDMKEFHIGYLRRAINMSFLQKNMDIYAIQYDNPPQILKDIVSGKLDGGVLSLVIAHKYVEDLYNEELKVIYPPLTSQAIRLVTLKNHNLEIINLINSSLERLDKNGKLARLKAKWHMPRD